MQCDIYWNSLTQHEWQSYFDQIPQSTLLQSYSYAQAIRKTHAQKARWGLIIIDGKKAGLVQIFEAGLLWNLYHAVILDRGPLWFEGFGTAVHIKLFFDKLNKEFPLRFGRRRRIIPEIQDGPAAQNMIKQAGFEKVKEQPGYQTLWWDVTIDEPTARENLKSNWRGSLKKAEAAGLDIQWDIGGKFYPWLRNVYIADRQKRGYGGPSPKLLDNLALFSTPENPMIIGKAHYDGRDIAAIMILKHGRSATYQVGWISDVGRPYSAHHLLLWQGRNVVQDYGIKEIDLGGVNDDTALGVKKFKEGTNAEISKLVGHYR